MSLKTFRDVTTVSQDVIDVATSFPDLAPVAYTLGKDAVHVALTRTPGSIDLLVTDAQAAYAKFQADKQAAAPAMEKLIADLKTLAADVTG